MSDLACTPTSSVVSMMALPKLVAKGDDTCYHSWKEMLIIALKLRKLNSALEEPESEIVALQARYLILEALDETHKSQVRGCSSAREIVERLDLIYADRSAANKYRMLMRFLRCQKLERESVSEHIGRMDGMRAALSDVGLKTLSGDENLYQVVLINSLPEHFEPDKILESWENSHESMQTTSNLVRRIMKKEEQIGTEGLAFAVAKMKNMTIEERKKITNCNKCGRKGHWSRECSQAKHPVGKPAWNKRFPEKITDDEKIQVSFSLGELGTKILDKWVADSGATSHMSNNSAYFNKLTLFSSPRLVSVGDGNRVEVLGCGQVKVVSRIAGLTIEGTLEQVLFVPALATNLFSISAAASMGIITHFDVKGCKMMKEDLVVAEGSLLDENLWVLNFHVRVSEEASLIVRPRRTIREWHEVLGHAGMDRIKTLANEGMINIEDPKREKLSDCAHCAEGKGKHGPHPSSSKERNGQPGQKIHIDLVYLNKGGYNYYLLGKDEASEFCLIYFLRSKTETFTTISKLLIDVENGCGNRVKIIQSDNGSEFNNSTIDMLLSREAVKHTTSAPYTPQQNGIVEREVQTINNMARTMWLASGLDEEALIPALEFAAYVKNRLPTKRSSSTPFERFVGRKPRLDNLVKFGSQVQILAKGQQLGKFDSRTERGHIVGNTSRSNTYRVYIPERKRIIETSDVFFTCGSPDHLTRTGSEAKGSGGGSLPNLVQVIQNDPPNLNQQEDQEWVTCANNVCESSVCHSPPTLEGPFETPAQRVVTGSELDRFFTRYTAGHSSIEDSTSGSESPPSLPPRHESLQTLSATGRNGQVELSPPVNYSDAALVMMQPLTSTDPQSFEAALSGPDRAEWLEAIESEKEAHIKNHTWSIVDKPKNGTLLSARWIFTTKRLKSGEIERRKARLVARGYEQRIYRDYVETYAPVASIDSIRAILAVAAIERMKLIQFDVSTAFLNGELEEEIHIAGPPGIDIDDGKCLKLHKALYGLKQSPRAWNSKFDRTMIELGLKPTLSDPCVYTHQVSRTIVLIYVDDGLIVGKSLDECKRIFDNINMRFEIKLQKDNCFLGLEIEQGETGVQLSQHRFTIDLLSRFNMLDCAGASSPLVDTKSLVTTESPVTDAPYRQAIGALQFLCSRTRPDIMFAVNFLSRFNCKPLQIHWEAVKRVLRFLKTTMSSKLVYSGDKVEIKAYSDADWANEIQDRCSHSGVYITLGDGPVCFSSRKQSTIALSTAEAEYIAAGEAAQGISWLKQFLDELNVNIEKTTLFVDNMSTLRQIQTNESSRRSKHVDIKYHFVRNCFKQKLFTLEYTESRHQLADILTKSLPSPRVMELRGKMNILDEKENQPGKSTSLLGTCLLLLGALSFAEGYQFGIESALSYQATSYRVNTGIYNYKIIYVPTKFCDILDESDERLENSSIKIKAYKQLSKECKFRKAALWDPAFQAWQTCYKKRINRRKRSAAWLAVGLVVISLIIITSLVGSISMVVQHHQDIVTLKSRDTEKSVALKLIEHRLQDQNQTSSDQQTILELHSRRIHENRQNMSLLGDLLAQFTITTIDLINRMSTEVEAMRMMTESCKNGRFSPSAAKILFNQSEFSNFKEEDSLLENMFVNEDGSLFIDIVAPMPASNTEVLKVRAFEIYNMTNITAPMRYDGPEYILYNRSSDCKLGIREPEDVQVFGKCDTPKLVDQKLSSWRSLSPEYEIPPQVMLSTRGKKIYCLYHQILVQNKPARHCPPYPFLIPHNIEFKLPNHDHQVKVTEIKTLERRFKASNTHTFDPDLEFDFEGRLSQQIRMQQREKWQPTTDSFEWERGLTLKTGTMLTIAGITITFISCCITLSGFVLRNNQPMVTDHETIVQAPSAAPPAIIIQGPSTPACPLYPNLDSKLYEVPPQERPVNHECNCRLPTPRAFI